MYKHTTGCGREIDTSVTSQIYLAARTLLVGETAAVTRVQNEILLAAYVGTPVLHTRVYIRDHPSYPKVPYFNCSYFLAGHQQKVIIFFFRSSSASGWIHKKFH